MTSCTRSSRAFENPLPLTTSRTLSRGEVGNRGVRALDAPLRLLPLLLAPQRGLVEDEVRTADLLEPTGVHRVRVEDAVAGPQEVTAARVLDRPAVSQIHRRADLVPLRFRPEVVFDRRHRLV